MDLRELRKKRGLTIQELEERSGCGKLFITRLETNTTDIDNVRMGSAMKAAIVLGVSLDEFYHAAKATEATHKIGSPLMVKGEPRKIGGNRWKNRPKSPAEKVEVTVTMVDVDTTPEIVELPIIPVIVNDREQKND